MNPEHYKYMPHTPGEEPLEPQVPEGERREDGAAEEVVIVEEIEVVEAALPESDAPAPVDGEEDERPIDRASNKSVAAGFLMLMSKALMQFLYDIFNPFLLPAYCTLLIFELSILAMTSPGAAVAFTLTALGATCLFPLIVIALLRGLGVIDSISLSSRRQRIFPYILMFIGMGAFTIFISVKAAPQWMLDVYLGATTMVLVNFIVNFFLKVCNHCSGLAGILAMLFVIHKSGLPHFSLDWWIIGTVLLAGVIGAIAILTGRHKLSEVFVGYATGFLPVILFSLLK